MNNGTVLRALFLCIAAAAVTGCSEPGRQRIKAYHARLAQQEDFRWPEGKRAAISLTFDDARSSQTENCIPVLDKYSVKATFYVTPKNVIPQLADWRRAVANGHEIGNHTVLHPCSGNFRFARHKALEEYTLEKMAEQLDDANIQIENLLGVTPVTYAYTCGQTFVGRGPDTKSYVPLVAERFIVGRGYRSETANDPTFCDLAQAAAFHVDGMDGEEAKKLIDRAAKHNRWIIFAGHEVKPGPGQGHTSTEMLEAICRYAAEPKNKLWIDTVAKIGSCIHKQRTGQ